MPSVVALQVSPFVDPKFLHGGNQRQLVRVKVFCMFQGSNSNGGIGQRPRRSRKLLKSPGNIRKSRKTSAF